MDQTGYGILDFYRTASTRGLARNNLYRIKSMGEVFGGDTELLIFAKDGLIPSRMIQTAKVNFKAYEFNVPMNASYPENSNWTVNFYCDKSYAIRDIMENWSRTIYDEHKNITTGKLVDIELVLLDNSSTGESKEMKEVRKYTLAGCYPTQVGSITYNQGSGGEFATMGLTIAFQNILSER